MIVTLHRLFRAGAAQIGLMRADGAPVCFTLEDVPHETKIAGETCIPGGIYELGLRKFGGMFDKYRARWPWNSHGMLELERVRNFTDVLIHCGNTEKDTAGCILVADCASCTRAEVTQSLDAYRRLYLLVTRELLEGRAVFIGVHNER